MNEQLDISTEQVDDIALLLSQLEQMQVSQCFDQEFKPHGNWQGLSMGKTVCVWLTHILSMSDHRMNQVEDWSRSRLKTLEACLQEPVRPGDFTDDRLTILLRALGRDESWDDFESCLNHGLLRIYDLSVKRVRLDSTTISGYAGVTEDGLFQFGHSKDKRPDLPQVKVMLSCLDPLGLPLGIEVLSGQSADDPLYVPAVERARRSLKQRGVLYIGDSKMASFNTRSFIADGDDFYLCPLPQVQYKQALEAYLMPVWNDHQPLQKILRSQDDMDEHIADGYEVEGGHLIGHTANAVAGERCLVIRSLKLAQGAQERLDKQIGRLQDKLSALNERKQGRKRYTLAEMQARVERLLKGSSVAHLFQVDYDDQTQKRSVKGYRDKPDRVEEVPDVTISVKIDRVAYEEAVRYLGWRLYVTNAPEDMLSMEQAILAYREEYLIERNFRQLKNKPLSIKPMYLQTDAHVKGLLRLLSIALKTLVLLEQSVRKTLQENRQEIQGLYAGNPKRATKTPTASQVLGAFKQIYLTIIYQQQQTIYHLTALTDLQKQILGLIGLEETIYTGIPEKLKVEKN